MIPNQSTTLEKQLHQIADMLILNGTLVECPGLVNGKTGIVVFFFHYAQYTGNGLFEDYAFDLIEALQTQIHNNSPADYENGLAGIGVGMDYLSTNQFLSIDEDFLEDFDQRMYRAVMYDPWQDFSLYNGLSGYGQYWMMRLRYPITSVQARECLMHIVGLFEGILPNISIDEQTDVYCFLHDLCQIQGFEKCNKLLRRFNEQKIINFSRLRAPYVGNVVQMVQQCRYFNCTRQDEISAAMKLISDLYMGKPSDSIGLLNGYAGEGMMRLTLLNQTNMSWMNLL